MKITEKFHELSKVRVKTNGKYKKSFPKRAANSQFCLEPVYHFYFYFEAFALDHLWQNYFSQNINLLLPKEQELIARMKLKV